MENIKKRIQELLISNTQGLIKDELLDDTELISSGLIDSFELIKLLGIFEKEFDIELPIYEIELSDFETVNSMADMIADRM